MSSIPVLRPLFFLVLLSSTSWILLAGCSSEPAAPAPTDEPPAVTEDTSYVPAYPEEVSDEALSEQDRAQQKAIHDESGHSHGDGADHDHDDGADHDHGSH